MGFLVERVKGKREVAYLESRDLANLSLEDIVECDEELEDELENEFDGDGASGHVEVSGGGE